MSFKLPIIKAVIVVLTGFAINFLAGYLYQVFIISNYSVAQLKDYQNFPSTIIINLFKTIVLWLSLIFAGFIIGKSTKGK
jgi:site-specific recombinase